MSNFLYKFKIIYLFLLLLILFSFDSKAEIINKFNVSGNERISSETIIMFSDIKIDQNLNENDLNEILKRLYDTNFFELVSVELKNNILNISVKENPIIQNVVYNGVKSDTILSDITKDVFLKFRSSFN